MPSVVCKPGGALTNSVASKPEFLLNPHDDCWWVRESQWASSSTEGSPQQRSIALPTNADNWPPRGLAKPAQRALSNAGIASLRDLARRTQKDVAGLHGMGPTGVVVLSAALAAAGLAFKAATPTSSRS